MAGRSCSICELDPKTRLKIDRALVRGTSLAGISRVFKVSESALANHRDKHLSRQILLAKDVKRTLDANMLVEEINGLVTRTKAILDTSERDGQKAISLSAIRELRASYEFMVRLACTLHEMKAKQAEEESTANTQTLEDMLADMDPFAIKLFSLLTRHLDGQDIKRDISALAQSLGIQQQFRPEPCPVIDVEPPHIETCEQQSAPLSVKRTRTKFPPTEAEQPEEKGYSLENDPAYQRAAQAARDRSEGIVGRRIHRKADGTTREEIIRDPNHNRPFSKDPSRVSRLKLWDLPQ